MIQKNDRFLTGYADRHPSDPGPGQHLPRAIWNQPRDKRQRFDVDRLRDDLAAEYGARRPVICLGTRPAVAGVFAAVEPGDDAVPPVRALHRPPRHRVAEGHAAGQEPGHGGLDQPRGVGAAASSIRF